MEFIHFKVLITILVVWICIHAFSMPESKLAKWGEKKFGSYLNYMAIYTVPALCIFVIYGLYIIWTL